ncbi:MAG TPA: transcriptional repressor [Candidatus Binatia bacterium]|nr:transcriptional repressor [Candidatus Binatia bacterium]
MAARRKLVELVEACRRHGVPVTVQRRAVLEVLASREDHPTADQVWDAVRERLPGLSRTTVYRVLDTLVGLRLAVKTCHAGSNVRFDAKTGRHHHLVCVQCERVMDLDVPDLDALDLPDTRASGFEVEDYSVYFRGRCVACRQGRRPGAARKARRTTPRGQRGGKR